VTFVRRKGTPYFLVHNVRQQGKVQELHLEPLGTEIGWVEWPQHVRSRCGQCSMATDKIGLRDSLAIEASEQVGDTKMKTTAKTRTGARRAVRAKAPAKRTRSVHPKTSHRRTSAPERARAGPTTRVCVGSRGSSARDNRRNRLSLSGHVCRWRNLAS
jgi:hypothetical protein